MKLLTKSATFLKCTAKRVFPTKNRNSPCNKSDKPWFNKSCLEKHSKFHTANNRYSFVKNRYSFVKNRYSFAKNRYSFAKHKENRDAMKKNMYRI